MKQTIFQFKVGDKNMEHKVDFIYQPIPDSQIENLVSIDAENGHTYSFSISKIIDQFTNNPNVHIRYIKLSPHEKQIL